MRQVNAAGLPLTGPEATFITHLHSDHTLGYPDHPDIVDHATSKAFGGLRSRWTAPNDKPLVGCVFRGY